MKFNDPYFTLSFTDSAVHIAYIYSIHHTKKDTITFTFIGGIDIPLKKLLLKSGSSFTTNLRHHLALTTLFKFSPSGEIPSYVKESFDTCFTWRKMNMRNMNMNMNMNTNTNSNMNKHNDNGSKIIMMTRDKEINHALEIACTENLFCADDGVILDIDCTIVVSTYKKDRFFSRIASMLDEKLALVNV